MGVVEEYRRQFGWRAWGTLMDALPELTGRLVLDLGCGVGDQAAELVSRGARIIGLDANEELLNAARQKVSIGATFQYADLRALPEFTELADGIWCSFSAAYFVDFVPVLRSWSRRLRPGGWIALTEIDDLFGHEPLSFQSASLLNSYAKEAMQAGRYDFHMGRKLKKFLEEVGLHVHKELTPLDQEFSFVGPASPDVIEAWRARLERMKLLHVHCGGQFANVRNEFLACLQRTDHVSRAQVRFCLAVL